MLAAGERGAVQDGADQGHRVVARIVAVGLRAGEELIDCVAGAGGIDLEDRCRRRLEVVVEVRPKSRPVAETYVSEPLGSAPSTVLVQMLPVGPTPKE